MAPKFTSLLLQDSQLYIGAMVLLLSIFIAKIAPLPRQWQPLEWLTYLAVNLSVKVNHSHRAPSQQIIAGTLSTLLLVLPFWLVIYFFFELTQSPWFVEALVIYVCLQDDNFKSVAKEVTLSLRHTHKVRARTLLQPWVNRNTQSLSIVGLSKVTIERLATTPVYGIASAVIFYCLGGAPLLLAARMIKQLDNVWPVINPQYRFFGLFTYVISSIVHFIPAKLWGFSLAIQGGPKSLIILLNPKINAMPIIEHQTTAVTASALNIELGGPAKFTPATQQKVMLPKLTYGRLPDLTDIQRALTLTTVATKLWVFTLVLIPCLWAVLRIINA